MSGHGAPTLEVSAAEMKVVVIASSWHDTIMNGLIDGAKRAVSDAGATLFEVVRVPGSFELPVVAAKYAQSKKVDAVVALGVVIKGGTPHFEYVCQGVTYGLTKVAVENQFPVGFGVLTVDNEQQALDRAGIDGSSEDKGYEAAQAALLTAISLANV